MEDFPAISLADSAERSVVHCGFRYNIGSLLGMMTSLLACYFHADKLSG